LNDSNLNLKTFENLHLFDLTNNRYETLDEVNPELNENRIIIIGEQHDNKYHHMSQLQIIKALHSLNREIAIGLEMFKSESQDALDRWVSGEMTEENFQESYNDNWSLPISLYMMIFEFAKEAKIPLVGLNVPRSITFNVAKGGFQSLQKEEKEKLQNIVCEVDSDYEAYIKRAYGSHAHGDFNFTYFCEAQLVWDTIMAVNALKYLENNQETLMVVLSGVGHASKWGIPEQIRKRSTAPYKVILPYISGHIEPNSAAIKYTDYIIMPESVYESGVK
jgi:uncharacterized iron-regulated protein